MNEIKPCKCDDFQNIFILIMYYIVYIADAEKQINVNRYNR